MGLEGVELFVVVDDAAVAGQLALGSARILAAGVRECWPQEFLP